MNVMKIPINTEAYFEFKFYGPITELHCCSEQMITFVHGKRRYKLSGSSHVRSTMEAMVVYCGQALAGALVLPLDFQDIGRIRNMNFFDTLVRVQDPSWKPGGPKSAREELRYELWAGNYTTWLYNDADGHIILELTPWFPGNTWANEDAIATRPQFELWLKTYRPLFKSFLSRDIAQEWIDIASNMLQQIDENITRMRRAWEQNQQSS